MQAVPVHLAAPPGQQLPIGRAAIWLVIDQPGRHLSPTLHFHLDFPFLPWCSRRQLWRPCNCAKRTVWLLSYHQVDCGTCPCSHSCCRQRRPGCGCGSSDPARRRGCGRRPTGLTKPTADSAASRIVLIFLSFQPLQLPRCFGRCRCRRHLQALRFNAAVCRYESRVLDPSSSNPGWSASGSTAEHTR